jgi:hypothetical protein
MKQTRFLNPIYADGTDRQIELIPDRNHSIKQVFFIADGINLELKKTQ